MSQNTKAIPPSPEQVDAFLDWLGPKRLSQIPDNPDIMFNSFGFIRMLMATTSRIERMEAKQKEDAAEARSNENLPCGIHTRVCF